jgi:hypothetical protein
MPPKVPRATDWRPPTDADYVVALSELNVKKLWETLRDTLPSFTDLSRDDQIYTASRVACGLLEASLAYRSHLERPRLLTMRKNIGELLAAIEATLAARKALDVVSGTRLALAAGDYQNTAKETVIERGNQQWGRVEIALKDAASWTASALNDIPPGKEKKGAPYGLDALISDLADVYQNSFVPKEDLRLPANFNFTAPGGPAIWDAFVRRIESPDPAPRVNRSSNKGGFLAFATKVVELAPGFPPNLIEEALRRIQPRLSRRARRTRRMPRK